MGDIDEEYDVVVLGTGLIECVISGALSVKEKKVLHIDRNDYYGGEAASVNMETLFRKFRTIEAGSEPWKKYGDSRSWNIDLVSKLIMSNGELTKILVLTKVTKYLEFKQIAGSFVQQTSGKKPTIDKVPSCQSEALSSKLMGMWEKLRAKSFFSWVENFDRENTKTHNGLDINNCTMHDVYEKFGLEANTRDFIGHALALYQSDDYMKSKGMTADALNRIRLYGNSMRRYGKSPYIYPLYGLGELPQAFARLSAIHGGTYMLSTSLDEVLFENGKVSGIKATMRDRSISGDEENNLTSFTTKVKQIVADPSYFPEKTNPDGFLLKAICILKHPVDATRGCDSFQLIIPQSQVSRKHDIYIAVVSSVHKVCPDGYYIAIVSTISETPDHSSSELQAGFDRLNPIEDIFQGDPIPLYSPKSDGKDENIFISKSYDATSHFESTTDDIKDIYQRVEGKPLDFQGIADDQHLYPDE